MVAYGYIRKSVMADDSTTLSPEVQRDRIGALAKAHGDDDLVILEDLDVSGAKVEERVDYMRLVRAIEDGDATAVYAYDLSRLHRNTKEALRFFEIADAHHVPVRLVAESIDTSGPTGTLMLTVLSAMNAWTSQVTSAKIKATFNLKRKRGEPLGGRPYGDVRTITLADKSTRTIGVGEDAEGVIEAYRATRSFLRAAKTLDRAGVPTRNGASRGWSPSAVKAIVGRLAPDLIIETRVEDRPIRGSRATAQVARFGRVLRCSVDGALLTPSYDQRPDSWRYYCHGSHRVGHGRKGVTEAAIIRAIIPAIEATAMRMRLVSTDGGPAVAIDTEALAARRERFIEMYGEGLVTKDRRDEVIAEVEAELIRAQSMRRVRRYTLPPDPAADSPESVNAWMRDTFDRIVVDMATPGKRGVTTEIAITPEWHDPSMRVEVGDGAA
jgi:DNA invertase Pin-like site-specific DNA recombinase